MGNGPCSFQSQQILSALLLCLVLEYPSAANAPAEVPIGGTLRDAALQGLNGPSRKLNSFRGRPLLINVWASWCGPCRQEMASLERLAWRADEQYFAIIGISTDDYADRANGLLNGTNATISHFIDHDQEMENMLGASRLPLTVLVDAKGRVLKRVYGAQRWDSADALRLIDETFHYNPPTMKNSKAPFRVGASIPLLTSGAKRPQGVVETSQLIAEGR